MKNIVLTGLVALLFLPHCVFSNTITCVPIGGNWHDASTWIGGSIPNADDDVVITLSPTYFVMIEPANTVCVQSVTIDGFLYFGLGASLLLPSGGTVDFLSGDIDVPDHPGPGEGPIYIKIGTLVGGEYSAMELDPLSPPVQLTEGGPLPVELVYFTGTYSDRGSVDLSWVTASELNNSHFQVQRRGSDSWTVIGQVAGMGTIQQTQYYCFSDSDPLPGVNYYRLQQVDFDGGFEYSPIISVNVPRHDRLQQSYPNPVTAGTQVPIFDDGLWYAWLDGTGRMIAPLTTAGGVITAPNEPGIYWLLIQNQRGERKVTTIVVQ